MFTQIIYAISLTITIFFSFILENSRFSSTILVTSAVLSILFIVFKHVFKKRLTPVYFVESILASFIITQIINQTGALQSPFFPLLYFLIFALALLLDPFISFTASVILALSYIIFSTTLFPTISSYFPLIVLVLLSPFAIFLSAEIKNNERLRKRIGKNKEQDDLFLSLIVKKHLHVIRESVQNGRGDGDLESITKTVDRLFDLIDRFEKDKDV